VDVAIYVVGWQSRILSLDATEQMRREIEDEMRVRIKSYRNEAERTDLLKAQFTDDARHGIVAVVLIIPSYSLTGGAGWRCPNDPPLPGFKSAKGSSDTGYYQ